MATPLKPLKMINKPLAECYPEVADDEDEKLLADVRRHWLGAFGIVFSGIFIAVLILVLASFTPSVARSMDFNTTPTFKGLIFMLALIVEVLIFIGTAISLWVYNHSRLLITDQNVIELRQMSLFSHKVAHLNMINVEDVSVVKRGILQTLFDYGTMTIQTAGEQENFIFPNTPDPDTYRRMVINAHEDAIDRVGQMGTGTAARVEIAKNGL